ncbi:MAG: hypothetical protein M5U26_14440 [Planctomycetota bacterium]|nr:hypothetical protein [Planctomycetota bacterium]
MLQRRFAGSPRSRPRPVREIHYIKNGHRYTLRYDRERQADAVGELLRLAVDPRFNFDLDDARRIFLAHGLASFHAPGAP